jgi:hypothetical protein
MIAKGDRSCQGNRFFLKYRISNMGVKQQLKVILIYT